MSRQVSQTQLGKIGEMVARAKGEGAQLFRGGRKADRDTGYFFEPTVLGGCRQERY